MFEICLREIVEVILKGIADEIIDNIGKGNPKEGRNCRNSYRGDKCKCNKTQICKGIAEEISEELQLKFEIKAKKLLMARYVSRSP